MKLDEKKYICEKEDFEYIRKKQGYKQGWVNYQMEKFGGKQND